jgi:hypothetical protein
MAKLSRLPLGVADCKETICAKSLIFLRQMTQPAKTPLTGTPRQQATPVFHLHEHKG